MATGGGRLVVLCIPAVVCIKFQWVLSAADHGAVDADGTRDRARVPFAPGKRRVEEDVRYGVRGVEHPPGDLLRRGAGERGSRRAVGCGSLLLPAALDELACGSASGDS